MSGEGFNEITTKSEHEICIIFHALKLESHRREEKSLVQKYCLRVQNTKMNLLHQSWVGVIRVDLFGSGLAT